jgi:hypothetical protein
LPNFAASYLRNIDAVEQHGELGGVEVNGVAVERRQREAAALKTLVVEDEPAAVEGEDLGSVVPFAEEHEEVTGVDVETAGGDEAGESVEALAHIGRLGGEKDPN